MIGKYYNMVYILHLINLNDKGRIYISIVNEI